MTIGGTTLTRRRLLGSAPAMALAVATPAAAIACSMPIDGGDTALFALIADEQAAQADLAKAKTDLEWIAAEWKHLWPLAPEELLGVPWGDGYLSPECGQKGERDIAGKFVMRERVTLTKRLSKKSRAEGGTACFGVETSASVAKDLARWRADVPKGRTAKSLAVNQKFRRDQIKRLEHRHALAVAYEAETARLRQVSGAEPATARLNSLMRACYDLSETIMRHPATTMEGVSAKVDLYVSLPRVVACFDNPEWRGANSCASLAFGWHLSHDIKRLRGKAVQS